MEKWRIPKKVLVENSKEYQFDLTSLEISGIPRDNLDIALNDAIQLVELKQPGYVPVLDFQTVNESLIKTYPAEKVKSSLLKKFPELDPSQIRIVNVSPGEGKKFQIEDWVGIFLPDKGNNLTRFIHFMKVCGYTFQKAVRRGAVSGWETLYFSPNFQVPRDMDGIYELWHISPKRFEKSILEKGFVPYSKNSKFKYHPDRIYFFLGNLSKKEVIDLGEKLWKASTVSPTGYFDTHEFVLYKIAKYKTKAEFYIDPDWSDVAVYTTENIPASAIVSREDVRY